MGCATTPRRSRRSWDTAAPVSVRDALLNSGRDLSIVSEVSSHDDPTPRKEGYEEEEAQHRRTPGVAWQVPVEDLQYQKPDPNVVSTLPKRSKNHSRSRRVAPEADNTTKRPNRRSWGQSNPPSQENVERLTGIRSRVRGAQEVAGKAKLAEKAKHDVKKLLSTSRARQKVLKTRNEDFSKTIHLLESKCSIFHRPAVANETIHASGEEACIKEVQRAAYDRWEKAVQCAKEALEEVIEAEKVLGFGAEFDALKGLMETHGQEWDVAIDKYIDLYKNLQTEYPQTTPIRRSKIIRKQPVSKDKKAAKPPRPEKPPSMMHEHTPSDEQIPLSCTTSCIPKSGEPTTNTQRFDPNYVITLGRRFAHSAEMWFLKLIHKMVGIEFAHSVYCREDCYRLMENFSKLQNWLLNAKGTRMDRREVLLSRLRDTVIRWSSQMFELPLAKTSV